MVKNGTFKKTSIEGLAELLTALDAADHLEKAQAALETTVTIDGNKWTIERKRPNSSYKNEFEAGQEIEFNTLKPGFKPKCTTNFDGKKLVIKAVDQDYEQTMELDGDKLKETFTVKGNVCTRWSDRV